MKTTHLRIDTRREKIHKSKKISVKCILITYLIVGENWGHVLLFCGVCISYIVKSDNDGTRLHTKMYTYEYMWYIDKYIGTCVMKMSATELPWP